MSKYKGKLKEIIEDFGAASECGMIPSIDECMEKIGDLLDEVLRSGSEDAARMIYAAMQWAVENPPAYGGVPDWQEGGNSDAQTKARDVAKRIIG